MTAGGWDRGRRAVRVRDSGNFAGAESERCAMVGQTHRETKVSADRLDGGRNAAGSARASIVLGFATLCLLGACQSAAPARGPSRNDPDTPVVKAEETPITRAPTVPALAPVAPTSPANAATREDGRPDWWFREVERNQGRVKVCAEALAPSMVEARRAALDAARTKARRAMGLAGQAAIPDEEVVYAWAWPLPHARVGTVKYAGYVMLNGRESE